MPPIPNVGFVGEQRNKVKDVASKVVKTSRFVGKQRKKAKNVASKVVKTSRFVGKQGKKAKDVVSKVGILVSLKELFENTKLPTANLKKIKDEAKKLINGVKLSKTAEAWYHKIQAATKDKPQTKPSRRSRHQQQIIDDLKLL